MNLAEKLDHIVEVTKRTKEDWVAEGSENPDLTIYVHFWRGDDMVVAAQCPLDRDAGLRACMVGAAGFNADTVAITFESYHTDLKESPITGERWLHQEMQYLAETNPDAIAKGWVAECLTTSIHARDGSFGLKSVPYQIKEGKVTWLEGGQEYTSEDDPDAKGGGVMFDYLQEAMKKPTILEHFREQARDNPETAMVASLVTDPEEQLFHSDVATAQALSDQNLTSAVMFAAEPDSNRQRWLTERFGPPEVPEMPV